MSGPHYRQIPESQGAGPGHQLLLKLSRWFYCEARAANHWVKEGSGGRQMRRGSWKSGRQTPLGTAPLDSCTSTSGTSAWKWLFVLPLGRGDTPSECRNQFSRDKLCCFQRAGVTGERYQHRRWPLPSQLPLELLILHFSSYFHEHTKLSSGVYCCFFFF